MLGVFDIVFADKIIHRKLLTCACHTGGINTSPIGAFLGTASVGWFVLSKTLPFPTPVARSNRILFSKIKSLSKYDKIVEEYQ